MEGVKELLGLVESASCRASFPPCALQGGSGGGAQHPEQGEQILFLFIMSHPTMGLKL